MTDAAGKLGAAVLGCIVGAVVVMGAEGIGEPGTQPSRARPSTSPSDDASPPPRAHPGRRTLLAWTPGGFHGRVLESMRASPGVRRVAFVTVGLDWITATRTAHGAPVHTPPRGYAIPIEMAVVQPRSYAAFVPPSDRARVLSLRPGTVLLARTAARLREGGAGLTISFADGRAMRVAGVVSDQATSGYEAITTGRVPRSWARTDNFILADASSTARRSFARTIRRTSGSRQVRIRDESETPFLRYGDAVLPQLLVKATFGEFAAMARPDGSIVPERAWLRDNIVTRDVPILGQIKCHRILFPQLRRALEELVAGGLAYLIDRGQYAGCYSPRFIDAAPGGRISHHSWGIAFDVNVSENAVGTKPDLDRRVVDLFERWGFTWGGRWLIPDGMHFEWVRFP